LGYEPASETLLHARPARIAAFAPRNDRTRSADFAQMGGLIDVTWQALKT
jgi:hypothetical protein